MGVIAVCALVGCANESSSTTTTTAAKASSPEDREHAVKELGDATKTLGEMNIPDLVPPEWLARTQCAIIVPSLGSGAFIVGASHGSGVATCRTQGGWSAPIFVKLTGVSAGLQAGGQSSDVLMLVTSKKGESKLFSSGGFKLGGDMSLAVGPVGKGKSKGGDTGSNADIVTYARTKGLFAGVQLDGMSLSRDEDANRAIYGNANPHTILSGGVAAPTETHALLAEVKSNIQ
jgi:lipid-binding SYLF domain-containing protein